MSLRRRGWCSNLPATFNATCGLADFFIGKPGPGSISEAVQQQLPVIVVRNSWTMPQERYNAQWVRENKVGLVLPSFRSIRAAVSN
jgi:UDP-N-acetylglucosamine:LPS N-acetylglucosamine transferase